MCVRTDLFKSHFAVVIQDVLHVGILAIMKFHIACETKYLYHMQMKTDRQNITIMITEDKQLDAYSYWGMSFGFYVLGIAIDAWTDKYFWYVLCSVFVIPLSVIINIIWRGWSK